LSATTVVVFLNRGTGHIAIRAENTAVPFQWL
jgi:hypothetical protein